MENKKIESAGVLKKYEYNKDLFDKLVSLQNKKVKLILDSGTSIDGIVISVSNDSLIDKQPYVMVDVANTGIRETFKLDEIKDVE
jgi:hypothetical protein